MEPAGAARHRPCKATRRLAENLGKVRVNQSKPQSARHPKESHTQRITRVRPRREDGRRETSRLDEAPQG